MPFHSSTRIRFWKSTKNITYKVSRFREVELTSCKGKEKKTRINSRHLILKSTSLHSKDLLELGSFSKLEIVEKICPRTWILMPEPLHGNSLTARSDEIILGNDMDREFGHKDIHWWSVIVNAVETKLCANYINSLRFEFCRKHLAIPNDKEPNKPVIVHKVFRAVFSLTK